MTNEKQAREFLEKRLAAIREVIRLAGWDSDKAVVAGSVIKNVDDGRWEIELRCQLIGYGSKETQEADLLGTKSLDLLIFDAMYFSH